MADPNSVNTTNCTLISLVGLFFLCVPFVLLVIAAYWSLNSKDNILRK